MEKVLQYCRGGGLRTAYSGRYLHRYLLIPTEGGLTLVLLRAEVTLHNRRYTRASMELMPMNLVSWNPRWFGALSGSFSL